jgi:hypothetical protein
MIFWETQMAHVERLLKYGQSLLVLPEMHVCVAHMHHGVACYNCREHL